MRAEKLISGPIVLEIEPDKWQVFGKFYMITFSFDEYIEVNCMFN